MCLLQMDFRVDDAQPRDLISLPRDDEAHLKAASHGVFFIQIQLLVFKKSADASPILRWLSSISTLLVMIYYVAHTFKIKSLALIQIKAYQRVRVRTAALWPSLEESLRCIRFIILCAILRHGRDEIMI